MPYEEPANAALEDGGEGDGASKDSAKESSDNCFYLPGDFPGAENLKAGDKITLLVRGKDADGDIEVEHADEGSMGEGKGVMDHFDEEMGSSAGSNKY